MINNLQEIFMKKLKEIINKYTSLIMDSNGRDLLDDLGSVLEESFAFNRGTPPTITTGVGHQKIRTSEPVLVLSNKGVYGVCIFNGEHYSMMSKALCGDVQMIQDDIVDPDNIVGWKSLPTT